MSPLKVLNWNVWCENGDLGTVIDFICAQDADIVCLQEVPEPLLHKLAEIPSYTLTKARDSYHRKNGARIPSFLVILSKRGIYEARAIKFKRQPKRSLIARLLGFEECLEFQYADIMSVEEPLGGKEAVLRIFNAHLESVAGPKLRIARFAQVLRFLDAKKKNIVCGDLNVFRAWYSWGWRLILGCSWDELWLREYDVFERMFARRGFANIFSGETTHAGSGNQLDYILVPNETKVLRRVLFEETHGSDHKPLLVSFSP
ncbi:MAG: endonuclease/exonuclease/phosphatase family protein [Parcubacteria group bacterium]|nr:endonuclease/exonuclease/phosphatase family protein [Parcubacteria group bacterium]